MTLLVEPIPVGARLFDTVEELTAQSVAAMRADGADGVIAYLRGNLTAAGLANAIAGGLGVCPVNFSQPPGWMPTARGGAAAAEASAAAMATLGAPLTGIVDWCDVEGVGADPTPWLAAWCASLTHDGAGRVPGAYQGAGARLNAAQWYALPYRAYWRSGSAGIAEPVCGWQLHQIAPLDQKTRSGLVVDYNMAGRDYLGRAPTWWRASA